ncbi:hypothetical protein GFGA_1d1009 [Gluconobacter frateurii NBRC 103465]|nr:hypothetical protein GFGA_1d1009 [Gluconobacter frateurii NBRC 103465]
MVPVESDASTGMTSGERGGSWSIMEILKMEACKEDSDGYLRRISPICRLRETLWLSVEQRASGLNGEPNGLLGELLPVSSLNCTKIVLQVLVGRNDDPENTGRLLANNMRHRVHPLTVSIENGQAARKAWGDFLRHEILPFRICNREAAGAGLPEHHPNLQSILGAHFAAEVGCDTYGHHASSQKRKREDEGGKTKFFHNVFRVRAF